jgi:membrane-bound serine protease (ClpP class)
MLPVVLLFTAFVLLFIEIYLPSGLVFLLSTCLLIYAVYCAFICYSLLGFFLFVVVAILIGVYTLWLAFYIIRKSAANNTLFLSADQKDFIVDHPSTSLVGREGITVSPLSPAGIVEIEGRRIQAQSQGLYIEKGVKVLVAKIQGSTCIVRETHH